MLQLNSISVFCICLVFALGFGHPLTAQSNRKAKQALEKAFQDLQNGAESQAIAGFQQALQLDSTLHEARIALGDLSRKKRSYADAVEHYESVIRGNASLAPQVWFGLGESLLHLGEYTKAKSALENYEKLHANRPERTRLSKKYLEDCRFSLNYFKERDDGFAETTPKNLGKAVNSEHDEYFPKITADQQILIFTRKSNQQENFFQTQRVGFQAHQWTPANLLHGAINSRQFNEGAHGISPDGKYLYFTGCNRPDGMGSCDIYVSRWEGSAWGKPRNLGSPINTSGWEAQPALSADGNTLYFVSNRRGGLGGYDLWKSEKDAQGAWQDPVNLGPQVNTPFDESSPFIHADNRSLFFASNGWPGFGDKDLYKVYLDLDGNWSTPENLGHPINDHTEQNAWSLSLDGKIGYFSSARAGGLGGLDIYSVELSEAKQASSYTYVEGNIIDAQSRRALYGIPILVHMLSADDSTKSESFIVRSDGEDGSFFVPLRLGKTYAFHVNHPGYLLYSKQFFWPATAGSDAEGALHFLVELQPIQHGQIEVLNNVFFNTGEHRLLPNSIAELRQLFEFLKKNPGVRIEIGGHTDALGSDTSNQALSERRATEVRRFLIDLGIDATRLQIKGYGASQPIDSNDTPEGRQRNRRTEFKIIGN